MTKNFIFVGLFYVAKFIQKYCYTSGLAQDQVRRNLLIKERKQLQVVLLFGINIVVMLAGRHDIDTSLVIQ